MEESDDEKTDTESRSDMGADAPGQGLDEEKAAAGKLDQPAPPSPVVAGAESAGNPSTCGPPQPSDTVDEASVDLSSAQQDTQPTPAPDIDNSSASLAAHAQDDDHSPTHDGEAAAEATNVAENGDALAPSSTATSAQPGDVAEAAHGPSIDAPKQANAEPATGHGNAADSMSLEHQPQSGQVSVSPTAQQSEPALAACEPPAVSAMDVDSSAPAADATGMATNAGEGFDQPGSMSLDQQPSQPQSGEVSVSPIAQQVDVVGSEAAPAPCAPAAISTMDVDSSAPTATKAADASDATGMATNAGESKDTDKDSREPAMEGDDMDSDVAPEPVRKPVKAVKPELAELPPGMYHRDGWSYIPMSDADLLLKALDKRGVREHPLHLALQYVYGIPMH